MSFSHKKHKTEHKRHKTKLVFAFVLLWSVLCFLCTYCL